MIKKISRKWRLGVLILFFSALYWHEDLFIHYFDLHKIATACSIVVGFPEGMPDRSLRPSFTGPHPSNLPRPKDPFPYPIKLGEVGPVQTIAKHPQQYPWICMIERSGLGQPIVDNNDGGGVAVYKEDTQPIT